MAIREHPLQGSIVTVNYSRGGFVEPEMVKLRLAVVPSPKIAARPHLCTVVPLSTLPPEPTMPYHKPVTIPFDLGKWGSRERWVKGDMVNAVGFHRIDLLRIGKDRSGKRIYQMQALPDELFKVIRLCVLHGLGFSALTKHL